MTGIAEPGAPGQRLGTDVDEALTHRELTRRLAGAQKSSKGAPAYSRFVNRPLGRQFAALAYRMHLTPNAVTAISGSFSFAAIAVLCLVRPGVLAAVLVTAGLVLGYALDAADGQLARLRGGGSFRGEWLDHMIDAAKISSLHLAVLIAGFRFMAPNNGWLLVPIGFTVIAAVSFFGMTLNDQLRRQAAARSGRPTAIGTTSGLRALLVIPTDYGLLCWSFVLLAWPGLFVWCYAFLFVCCAGFLALASIKWFRDMAGLDAGAAAAS